jgi:hypothetical protein
MEKGGQDTRDMTDNDSSHWIIGVLKSIVVLILTLVPLFGVLYILVAVEFIPTAWRWPVFLLTGTIFLIGSVALLKRHGKIWGYSLIAGFSVTGATIVAGGLLVLSMIPIPLIGSALNALAAGIATVSFAILYFMKLRTPEQGAAAVTSSSKSSILPKVNLGFRKSPEMVAGLEITQLPSKYVLQGDDPQVIAKKAAAFESVLRQLFQSVIPVVFRIQRFRNRTRVFFLIWSRSEKELEEYLTVLEDALESNLPGCRFRIHDRFDGFTLSESVAGAAAQVTGVPLPLRDEAQNKSPLDGMVTTLQKLERGIYEVHLAGIWDGESEVERLQGEYQGAVEDSEKTITKKKRGFFTDDAQESRRIVDPEAEQRAERLKREIERLSGSLLCRVQVSAVSLEKDIEVADRNARRLAGALVGQLRRDSRDQEFKIKQTTKQKEVQRLLRGLPAYEDTLLTADEAAAYVLLPTTDMGIKTVTREKFVSGAQSAPRPRRRKKGYRKMTCDVDTNVRWKARPAKLFFGPTLDESGRATKIPVFMDISALNTHLGVFGDIRSGKTTTVQSIAGQAVSLGVKPTILLASKTDEWRKFLYIFPDFRILTAGVSMVAPLVVNFWNAAPKAALVRHSEKVVNIFKLLFPTHPTLEMHLKSLVEGVYKRCGWDIYADKRGRPIMLTDFVEVVIKTVDRLIYGNEVNDNFRGALVHRAEDLINNKGLVEMYNTKEGFSIEELLAHPTIIEMDRQTNKDREMLMAVLTTLIAEYKENNPTKEITNMLVIEEAHLLLGEARGLDDATAAVRYEAQQRFVEMLRTVGGRGLCAVIIDQLPSRLIPEVVDLPVNKVIHSHTNAVDCELMGKHTRCTDAQIGHISGMGVGEAIVYLANDKEPKNVKIFPLQRFIKNRIPEEPVSNEAVRKHMESVFAKNPELCSSEPLSESERKRLRAELASRAPEQNNRVSGEEISRIDAIVTNKKYAAFCRSRLGNGSDGAAEDLCVFIGHIARRFFDGSANTQLELVDSTEQKYATPSSKHVFKQVREMIREQAPA